MKPFFKPEDFLDLRYDSTRSVETVANIANRILQERAVRVRGSASPYGFVFRENEKTSLDTHQALLINIQPILVPECQHQPHIGWDSRFGMTLGSSLECKHCGISLKATWSPA